MTHDLDPRQAQEVIDDLAVADAAARPVVTRGAGASNLAILAGFGLMGVGLFLWMSSHRADAHPKPRQAPPAAVVAVAYPPVTPLIAKSPPHAEPRRRREIADNAPLLIAPEPTPPPAPAVFDTSGRRRAPALIVDLSVSDKPRSAATAIIKSDGLSADERFADRVSLDETAPAKATTMRNLEAVVPQGAVIPAVMETAINSDLPGLARAMVTRDVKSFDGSTVLIQRGSRVIGQYKSGVALGASRVFVIWTRVIRPDGVTIQIGSPAADTLGRGGLEGKVDRHFFTRFGGSILMSVLNAGVAAISNVRTNSQIYIGSATEAANAAGTVKPNATSPTIQTPQGAPVTIFVARDLDFSGVRGGGG